jgi:stage V sporulation protein R
VFNKRHVDSEEKEKNESEFGDLFNIVKKEEVKKEKEKKKNPEIPEQDILAFIRDNAPYLEDWQKDIISIIREEMIYFLPQIRTKTINEGHASNVHERILTDLELTPAEHLEFRKMHSGVLSPGSKMSLNPYYIGYNILRDIEKRWNGESEEDELEKDWLGNPIVRSKGDGWKKVLEVTELECDKTLYNKYLTENLVKKLDMYTYGQKEVNGETLWVVQDNDWTKVRDELVNNMTNFGMPIIKVEDGDFHHAKELYLKHYWDGKVLDLFYTKRTLEATYRLWQRPVHLETKDVDGDRLIYSYDGDKHEESA